MMQTVPADDARGFVRKDIERQIIPVMDALCIGTGIGRDGQDRAGLGFEFRLYVSETSEF